MRRAPHQIPTNEQDDSIIYNTIDFESKYDDVLAILSVYRPNVAAVIPSYHDRGCFLTILARQFGITADDLIPANQAVGDRVHLGQSTSSLVKLPNGNDIILFSYADVFRHLTTSSMTERFTEIFSKVPEEDTQLIFIPFGVNNGYEFNRVSFVIHRDIKASVEELVDPTLKKITICCPENLPANRVIKHLKHLNYLHNKGEPVCPICVECIGTSYYVACGHSSFCQECARRASECPICRETSDSRKIPREVIGSGENIYIPECLCARVKGDEKPDHCKCGNHNGVFTKLFNVSG